MHIPKNKSQIPNPISEIIIALLDISNQTLTFAPTINKNI
jgi:hypothetical protein